MADARAKARMLSPKLLRFCHFRSWPEAAGSGRAEHVRSARQVQTFTCSAIASASSTSISKYRTVLSSLVCPRRSCTALKLPVRR